MRDDVTVSVYQRGRRFVVISSADFGLVTIWAPPVVSLPESATDEELGRKVLDAASAAVVLGDDPDGNEADSLRNTVLREGGFKNRAALERNAKLLHVQRRAGHWNLSRPRRHRTGGWIGHEQDDDLRRTLNTSVPAEELGAAIRQLLEPPTRHFD